MADMNCPYCGAENEAYEAYEQEVLHETECGKCEKVFQFYTSYSVSYSPQKADCLNDMVPHAFKPTNTWPPEYARVKCTVCEKEDFKATRFLQEARRKNVEA